MTIRNLNDLFVHTLKDIYFAEKQIEKALPRMIEGADDGKLRGLLEDHLDQTGMHIERLEEAFVSIGKDAAGKKCPPITGIIDEVEALISEIDDGDTRDAAMIGAAQIVEHYEITRYGSLCAWAERLGHTQAHNLLKKTLWEEEDTDARLSAIAKRKVDQQATV